MMMAEAQEKETLKDFLGLDLNWLIVTVAYTPLVKASHMLS